MDVDYVVAKQELVLLEDILNQLPHGEREEICDDIEEFVAKMKKKYKYE